MEIVQVLIAILMIIPAVTAHIADFDEVWQKRSEESKHKASRAYNPNPEKVVDHLNEQVHKSFDGKNNTTRRRLRRYSGPCRATNPIDRCWRCHGDWAANRMRLADCALGFGQGTTGGKGGRYYVVRDPSDDDMVNPKPGTLRHAVIQDGPLWIIFAHSMVIRLAEELIMTSNKTIDGRGVQVHIANGASFMLQFVHNIIIHGIHIHDIKAGNGGLIRDSVSHYGFRTQSDGDGISIFGATNIWIDHVSVARCSDGLIDAIMASTAITISNSHFAQHNEVMLFGASDAYSGDAIMQITVAFNHYGQGLIQRMPRCRWGFVHVVNNDYTHWIMYAIGGSQHPTIISQGNRFIAPDDNNSKEVTKRDYSPESVWKNWLWKSEQDLMVNGAFFVQSGDPNYLFTDKYAITAKPGRHVSSLTRYAGPLACKVGLPC